LRVRFDIPDLVIGIFLNLINIYVLLLSMNWLERKLGKQTLVVMKKFFGIILLAMAVQMFMNNV
jgi:multiple antibiotic resistance protein